MRFGGGMLCALSVVAALTFGGCGDDEDEPAQSGGTGAQGASGAEGASSGITAEEFLAKLLPEKELAVEGVVASVPGCEGVKVQPSFILVLSDAATQAEPETPLTELVEAEC